MGDRCADLRGHLAYGLILASELALSELPGADVNRAQLHVTVASDRVLAGRSSTGVGEGGVVMMERSAAGVRLSFPGSADFLLSAAADHVEIWPWEGVAPSTLRHLLIDHVVPAALSGRGELVLHASGVVVHGGAVLFVGPSGAGKSTLAAVLTRRGWPVICDDGARIVDSPTPAVVPSYPGLRLWPDGVAAVIGPVEGLAEVTQASSKRRWVPESQPQGPAPLACICVLDDGLGAPEAARMQLREAVVALMEHSYRLPGSDPTHTKGQLDRIAHVVESTPVIRLSYPYDFSRTGEVASLVEAVLADLPAPAPAPPS